MAFVGISGANVLPSMAQAALYVLALVALLRPPNALPGRELAVLTWPWRTSS